MATQQLPPVESMSADKLHQHLVEDAVKGIATDLPWAVAAYERIGKLTGRGPEDAYQSVREEVAGLRGGWRGMPML